jgi:hypothetical protein
LPTYKSDGSIQLNWSLSLAEDGLTVTVPVKVVEDAPLGSSVLVIGETSYKTALRVPAPWQRTEMTIAIDDR